MSVPTRGMRVLLLVAMVSSSLALGHGSAVAATASPRLMFAGHSYGTWVTGAGANAGKTANVVMWCRTKPGIHHSNSLASTNVPGALAVGEMVTTVDGTAAGAGRKAVGTANIQNISLLGGVVKVDQLKAVSTTIHDATGFQLSDAGAVWGDISVAGQPVPLPSQVPDPNTRVDIPGVGYMILNEQERVTTPTKAILRINMLHLFTTLDNPVLGTKKGMQIIVGHAVSGLVEVAGPLGGRAFTSKLTAGALSSGPSAALFLPCAGTDGQTRANTLAGFGVPGALSLGAGKNTGSGVVQPGLAKGEVTSTLQNVNLLAGTIKANAVNADVRAYRANGVRKFTDMSTGFVGLVINGQSYGGDAPPNTKVPIPNVGTLWLHRVVRTATGLRVTMLELKVTNAASGLPAGADLQLASAWIAIF